ncbi:MAG: class I SAM-dependent methyltransferase, partial [Sphingomonas sp.]
EQWRRTDRSFGALTDRLLDTGAFDAALDIGCGAGELVERLAKANPDAAILGVDISRELVAVARTRCAELANAHFEVADAAEWSPEEPFRPDLLISRHGVMFFADPVAAFARLRGATRSGGRIVFSCFAAVADNPWATLVTPAAEGASGYVPGPFAFADRDRCAAILTKAGWADATPNLVRFAYRVGEGDDPVEDAVAFLTRIGPAASRLRDAAPEDRPALLARLRAALAAQRNGHVVDFPAAAWLWTARATGETI